MRHERKKSGHSKHIESRQGPLNRRATTRKAIEHDYELNDAAKIFPRK